MLRHITQVAVKSAVCASEQWSSIHQPWNAVFQAVQQASASRLSVGLSSAAAAPAVRHGCWQFYSNSAYEQARTRHRKGITDGGLYLGAVVLGMIGFSYASVPLYRAFCQATGYGGAVGKAHNIEAKLKAREDSPDAALEQRAAAREIRVWFQADVADDMPWRFKPTQEYVTIHPGESTLAFFTAHNRSDHNITGVSTYNVVPDKAAYYFNKIQCFCFEEQRLRPGEVVDMPVFFYVDPELVDDNNCRNIHDITLSYTFYKVDEDYKEDDGSSSGSSGVRLHGPDEVPSATALEKLPASTQAAIKAAAAAAADGDDGSDLKHLAAVQPPAVQQQQQ